jgi:hypothetical protein
VTTLVQFAPSATEVFQFLAQLSDGQQYNIAVPWNPFGERWYLTVTDLSNNVVAHRPLVQSGPVFPAILTWIEGLATAALSGAHNVRVGELANVRIAQTETGFDGLYQALAIDPQTFAFALPANPNESGPVSGKLDFPLDLLAGYGIGALYYHADIATFEF